MTTQKEQLDELINQLRYNLPLELKQSFIGKDDVIDLMVLCAVAREHLLLIGPPGTAKSELIKRFVLLLGANEAGDLFEYLLTRFTEPNEIFGPVNIEKFKGGVFTRNIDRALPKARIAFLDEVFKANSAILNALLTILNERFFFNGLDQVPVPLISVYGAANEVPEGDDLSALYDRFLVRVRTDNVEDGRLSELLDAGWSLEGQRIRQGGRREQIKPVLDSIKLLDVVYNSLSSVNLRPIFDEYRELVRQIRSEGITLSDRRMIKLLKLIAAATRLRGENNASPADLWVLLHIWNKPEQISALHNIVNPVVERAGGRATRAERPLDDIDLAVQNLSKRILEPDQRIAPTVTHYGVLLHDLERVRQELLDHSATHQRNGSQERCERLIGQIEFLIDTVLDHMESEERI